MVFSLFDDPNCVGFVRHGTADEPGCAAVMSNGEAGVLGADLRVGNAGMTYTDYLGHRDDQVGHNDTEMTNSLRTEEA